MYLSSPVGLDKSGKTAGETWLSAATVEVQRAVPSWEQWLLSASCGVILQLGGQLLRASSHHYRESLTKLVGFSKSHFPHVK